MIIASTSTFESFYDKYSAMAYGIALQISPTQQKAQEIVVVAFRNAHEQNLAGQKYPSPCAALIRLLIKAAHEQLNNNRGKTNFKLKQFEKSPMLHHLLCEQVNIEDYCTENKMTRAQAALQLRKEFSLLRKTDHQAGLGISQPAASNQ